MVGGSIESTHTVSARKETFAFREFTRFTIATAASRGLFDAASRAVSFRDGKPKNQKKNRDILPGQHSRTAFLRIDEVYNFKVQTKVGFVVGGIACVVWIVSEESQSAAS